LTLDAKVYRGRHELRYVYHISIHRTSDIKDTIIQVTSFLLTVLDVRLFAII